MVEVFKTNVMNRVQATMLLERIHSTFLNYHANFDLEDCDKILRVECGSGIVHSNSLIKLLENAGFHAEILPDEIPLATLHRVHRSKADVNLLSLQQ